MTDDVEIIQDVAASRQEEENSELKPIVIGGDEDVEEKTVNQKQPIAPLEEVTEIVQQPKQQEQQNKSHHQPHNHHHHQQRDQYSKDKTLFCINIDQRCTEDILFELFLQVAELILKFGTFFFKKF